MLEFPGTHERIVCLAQVPYVLLVGDAFGRPTKLKEIGMAATRFKGPAEASFAAVALAAMIAAFAIGQARAQTVNPVPPPPPPTFNPSTPNTVPQAPYVPISPAAPSGLGSTPAPAPSSPAIAPSPPVPPQTANPAAEAKPALSRRHAGHHRWVRHRWNRRHARFHAVRVLGPAYYPGLGEFDPPYPNVCHFNRVSSGYYAGLWSSYSCSW